MRPPRVSRPRDSRTYRQANDRGPLPPETDFGRLPVVYAREQKDKLRKKKAKKGQKKNKKVKKKKKGQNRKWSDVGVSDVFYFFTVLPIV